MRSGFFTLAIALILSSGWASAFISGLEEKVTVGETPYELSFYVRNDSEARQPFSVAYAFPTKYVATEQPKWVEAKARARVSVSIYPENGFEGSTYIGMASAMLGGSSAEKNITITYAKANGCGVETKTTIGDDGRVTISAKNSAYTPKTFFYYYLNERIEGAPADWSISGEKTFTLGAFEERDFALKIHGESSYRGNLEFVYMCNGTELKETVPVEYAGSGIGSTLFAVIGSVSAADSEFMTDMFLVIIAAILLIAFVARMIRVLNRNIEGGGKNNWGKGT